MRPNHAFQRAISGLTHPISIAAILILLFNDHWLRWRYPSWLTGKLGDFAWLVFAPFIAALLFSWIIPRRLKDHEFVVGIASFALIGLWFVLAKTNPLVHHITVNTVDSIIGWQSTLRMDTSDLLALPGLVVGYWIWRYTETVSLHKRPTIYVVYALGVMATLATSPARVPYDSGLQCVLEKDGQLIAVTFSFPYTNFYLSTDGGLTWNINQKSLPEFNRWDECPSRQKIFTVTDPDNADLQYRFRSALSIDRSTDSGKTWTVDIDLSDLSKDVRRYYQHQKEEEVGAIIIADPGPFDAVFDDTTGNLVVAMGYDGMLVRNPNGQWNWIDVGIYRRENIYRFDRIFDLLSEEIILAGILTLLIFVSHLQARNPLFLVVIQWGAWVLWIIGVWLNEPKWRIAQLSIINLSPYIYYSNALAAVIALSLMVMPIANIIDQKISAKQITETLLMALGSAILFLFPYLLWSQGTIPTYSIASIFALLLGLSAAFGTGQYLKRRYPAIIPEKAPEM